ncbi:hypothetical protein JFQ95_000345, partial [Streptococcus iniae]|nr:hypothetical protein [Streptococcus iniae]ELY5751136.1 hypothetical protein [Streptococcus iniae]
KHKYLVGIKSFGINSGDQKVAQFKKNSQYWSDILGEIDFNAKCSIDKESADKMNHNLYNKLAMEISRLRNQRIESSKAQLKGFRYEDVVVESVYHVLMPTSKKSRPQIYVGETTYLPIDIDKIQILGATNFKNPTNFRFTDGNHVYKYTSADSQLHMTFNNKDIVVDTWDVNYIEDPFYLFENLHQISLMPKSDEIEQTVSWMIANKNNEVEASSGFNGFNGGSKLSRKDNYREKRIEALIKKYSQDFTLEQLDFIENELTRLLIPKYRTDDETKLMRQIRKDFIQKIEEFEDECLIKEVENLIYRDSNEIYIPIPDSRRFHTDFPDFFGPSIGTFMNGGRKLALDKAKRTFILRFIPSGDEIEAYINQENGKAIQSTKHQGILGEWIIKEVFQLKNREQLTYDKLVELQINAIRLTKYRNSEVIGIEFTWIDSENPPEDSIGWVSKR